MAAPGHVEYARLVAALPLLEPYRFRQLARDVCGGGRIPAQFSEVEQLAMAFGEWLAHLGCIDWSICRDLVKQVLPAMKVAAAKRAGMNFLLLDGRYASWEHWDVPPGSLWDIFGHYRLMYDPQGPANGHAVTEVRMNFVNLYRRLAERLRPPEERDQACQTP